MTKLIATLSFAGALVFAGGCVNVTVGDNNDDNGGSSTNPNNSGGGGTSSSGVPAQKKATDFSAEEQETFCEWFVDLAEPAIGEYECQNEITITIEPYSVAQCEAELEGNAGCPVSELESCFETIINDPCVLAGETAPPECAGLEQCADDTGGSNGDTENGTTTTEFCYDHDCNGDATGEQCFPTEEEYCDSLCQETNCISVEACEVECF